MNDITHYECLQNAIRELEVSPQVRKCDLDPIYQNVSTYNYISDKYVSLKYYISGSLYSEAYEICAKIKDICAFKYDKNNKKTSICNCYVIAKSANDQKWNIFFDYNSIFKGLRYNEVEKFNNTDTVTTDNFIKIINNMKDISDIIEVNASGISSSYINKITDKKFITKDFRPIISIISQELTYNNNIIYKKEVNSKCIDLKDGKICKPIDSKLNTQTITYSTDSKYIKNYVFGSINDGDYSIKHDFKSVKRLLELFYETYRRLPLPYSIDISECSLFNWIYYNINNKHKLSIDEIESFERYKDIKSHVDKVKLMQKIN